MAKVFDLVKVEDMSALSGAMSSSAKQSREIASKFVLSALQHFSAGKRLSALQENVDTFLSIRPRDLDVLDMTIRLLTPLKTKVNTKTKTLEILGLPSIILKADKPDTKEDTIKNKSAAETKKFREVFEEFAKGEPVAVANVDFYDGVNEGKAAGDASVIPETNLEAFDQDIFAYCKRVKEISVAKKAAADARLKAAAAANGEEIEEVHVSLAPAVVKKTGGYKSLIDSKVGEIVGKLTADHIAKADKAEVKELVSAIAAYEEEMNKLQDKLDSAKNALLARQGQLDTEVKAKAVSSLTNEELAAILAQRQQAA